jgi:hypothetical protein
MKTKFILGLFVLFLPLLAPAAASKWAGTYTGGMGFFKTVLTAQGTCKVAPSGHIKVSVKTNETPARTITGAATVGAKGTGSMTFKGKNFLSTVKFQFSDSGNLGKSFGSATVHAAAANYTYKGHKIKDNIDFYFSKENAH